MKSCSELVQKCGQHSVERGSAHCCWLQTSSPCRVRGSIRAPWVQSCGSEGWWEQGRAVSGDPHERTSDGQLLLSTRSACVPASVGAGGEAARSCRSSMVCRPRYLGADPAPVLRTRRGEGLSEHPLQPGSPLPFRGKPALHPAVRCYPCLSLCVGEGGEEGGSAEESGKLSFCGKFPNKSAQWWSHVPCPGSEPRGARLCPDELKYETGGDM